MALSPEDGKEDRARSRMKRQIGLEMPWARGLGRQVDAGGWTLEALPKEQKPWEPHLGV